MPISPTIHAIPTTTDTQQPVFAKNDYFGKLLNIISSKRAIKAEEKDQSRKAELSFSNYLLDRSMDFHSVPNTINRQIGPQSPRKRKIASKYNQ